MGNFTALAFMRGKCLPWSLRAGLLGLIVFAGLTYGDQVEGAEAGLLCISECNTCPVICAPPPTPPPPQQESSNPPPSPPAQHPPPQTYYSFPPRSPPQTFYTSPPPSPPSAPPPPPPKQSAPSSSYSSKGSPPPPSFVYFYDMPPSDQVPTTSTTGVLPKGSFPYYYPDASEAYCLPVHAFFLLVLLVQLVFSFW